MTSKRTFSLLSKPLGHCSPADTQPEAAAAPDQSDANPEAHPEQQQGLLPFQEGSIVTFLHAPDSQPPEQAALGSFWLGTVLCGSRGISQGPAAPDASLWAPCGREVPGVPPALRGEAVPGGGAAAADADDGAHRSLLLLDDAADGRAPTAGAEGGEVLLTPTQPPRGLLLLS